MASSIVSLSQNVIVALHYFYSRAVVTEILVDLISETEH